MHGEDVWVILFCDNLSAHLDQEVKTIFGNGKVLLFYFPPNMTNFIQPIDAGLGRRVRMPGSWRQIIWRSGSPT